MKSSTLLKTSSLFFSVRQHLSESASCVVLLCLLCCSCGSKAAPDETAKGLLVSVSLGEGSYLAVQLDRPLRTVEANETLPAGSLVQLAGLDQDAWEEAQGRLGEAVELKGRLEEASRRYHYTPYVLMIASLDAAGGAQAEVPAADPAEASVWTGVRREGIPFPSETAFFLALGNDRSAKLMMVQKVTFQGIGVLELTREVEMSGSWVRSDDQTIELELDVDSWTYHSNQKYVDPSQSTRSFVYNGDPVKFRLKPSADGTSAELAMEGKFAGLSLHSTPAGKPQNAPGSSARNDDSDKLLVFGLIELHRKKQAGP